MGLRETSPATFGPIFSIVGERKSSDPVFMNSKAAYDLCKADARASREWMTGLYLDTKNRLISRALESVGTINCASVFVREIAKRAILLDAAALILVHNHPSGDPEPSLCDREITRDVAQALRLFDVKLLDHIIIGAPMDKKQAYYSFADQGLMDEYLIMAPNFPR